VGKQIDFSDHRERGHAEHEGVLERLVLALGDREKYDFAVFTDVELCRTDEVTHVLHD
jgi:hypothetical protein